jgi:acrylyl-CoA reductase (NADPH)
MFNALVVEKDAEGRTSAAVQELADDRLPEGEVTVAVAHSTVNYKDGLCLGPGAGLVKTYPHVPGIDFAGTVEASDDPRYKPGDKVVLTGWHVGERHWGGYAERARVRADWLVPLPDGLTTRQAMAVGTAGFTAMLAVMALEDHGLTPGDGPVLVTGAAGGVGSVATAILANLGHEVAAVTGRPETEAYLRDLGATRIVPRADLAEAIKRPMESEVWAGCVDAVGGEMLARILGQLKYRGSAAAFAARMKSRNSGCGSKGFDFSSGWNCTPMNQGWSFTSTISGRRPSGDMPEKHQPLPSSASRYLMSTS